jgi:hypothetical protein
MSSALFLSECHENILDVRYVLYSKECHENILSGCPWCLSQYMAVNVMKISYLAVKSFKKQQ